MPPSVIWYQISAKGLHSMSCWGCTCISVPCCGYFRGFGLSSQGSRHWARSKCFESWRLIREECSSKGTAWTPALCWERAGHAPSFSRRPAESLKKKVGEEAAETGRALTSKALRFSPQSRGPESSFHSGLQTGGGRETEEVAEEQVGSLWQGAHKWWSH